MDRRSKLVILISNLMRSIRMIESNTYPKDECFFVFKTPKFDFRVIQLS